MGGSHRGKGAGLTHKEPRPLPVLPGVPVGTIGAALAEPRLMGTEEGLEVTPGDELSAWAEPGGGAPRRQAGKGVETCVCGLLEQCVLEAGFR